MDLMFALKIMKVNLDLATRKLLCSVTIKWFACSFFETISKGNLHTFTLTLTFAILHCIVTVELNQKSVCVFLISNFEK